MYDIIILGSGPAGLTAALYCSRAGKKTLVLGGDKLGGQMGGIPVLENYPGWAGSGMALAEFMKSQAESFGAEIAFAVAKAISAQGSGFRVQGSDDKEYESHAVIIATGASPRKLEIQGAREFMGKGVSYCATCDGFFYSGKTVLVIGGGNSALNDALYLADLAKNVKILYRKPSFSRAEQILVDRVKARENIECLFETELAKIEEQGTEPKEFDFIATTTDGREILCDGIFVAIGHEANTDYLSEEIKRDALGRIAPADLPAGMFIAGDVRSGLKMQIATAVGTGCEVAMDAIAYINTLG
ncbi:thioredoxin reductase [Bacteroidia bacterium]|nr:thioredoxin reductase [Bacteroidia bacterium]